MRFNHYLKRNESTESPSNLIIVDTESFIKKSEKYEEQTFRLGYAIHLSKQNSYSEWSEVGYSLKTVEDFWNLLDKFAIDYPKKRLYVIAHNMAYDYTILKLDSFLSSRKLVLEMDVISPVFIRKAGNMMFISSTNFFSESLKELGITFGLHKMDSPNFEKCTDEELISYNIRDTQVLTFVMKYYIKFLKENDLGCFKPTIAGQAINAFRHRFMHTNLLIHTYPEILEMEKTSFRGGRNETFRFEKADNIYELDVNSMYPFVMKTFKYPTIPLSTNPINNCTINDLKECISKDLFLLADCDLNLKKPFIATKRDKLLFPIGKFRQVITSPEIEYILNNPECGEIIKVNRLICYKQEKIFDKYVDFFYNLRQSNSNETIQYMCKKFLNSLYGKFGQKKSSETTIITDENIKKFWFKIMSDLHTFRIDEKTKIGNDLYFSEKCDGDYSKDSMPIISSAVTSFARRLLWELMMIAEEENFYYCDTDSLFVNQTGYDNLLKANKIDDKILGAMKCKKSGILKCNGNKDYIFDNKIKIKGIKKDAIRLKEGKYIQKQFLTKKSRYIKAIPDGVVRVEYVTKELKREYDKGIISGNRSFPFIFNEF
jgi:hypothetical protein